MKRRIAFVIRVITLPPVMIAALLFGLASGLVSLWKFLTLVQKKASDRPRDDH